MAIAALLAAMPPPVAIAREPGSGATSPRCRAAPARKLTLRAVDVRALSASLAKADGCWRVVNFWAGWCAPCRAELPALIALRTASRVERLEVVTVNLDALRNRQVAIDLLGKAGGEMSVNYQLQLANLGDLRPIVGQRWNGSLPLTLVIDPAGKTVVHNNGMVDARLLERFLVSRGL